MYLDGVQTEELKGTYVLFAFILVFWFSPVLHALIFKHTLLFSNCLFEHTKSSSLRCFGSAPVSLKLISQFVGW